jgi:alkylhydroperoxidase/carboxymuconolactone decarboxylase family protein YurZ
MFLKILSLSLTLTLSLSLCKKDTNEKSGMSIRKIMPENSLYTPEQGQSCELKEEAPSMPFMHGSHPDMNMPVQADITPENLDGNAIPLKKTGIGSVMELQRILKNIPDESEKNYFEEVFRLVFSPDNKSKNYEKARASIEMMLEKHPDFAPAYRMTGYMEINSGFNVNEALLAYKKAIELDPSYGEAHYGIAFLYAMMDREAGLYHLKKAMELGVSDEYDLAGRFYRRYSPSGSWGLPYW